jgi:nucleoid DNA-binding protein
VNIAPINSLIDFGKFIFKEKHKKINENNRLYSNIQIEQTAKLNFTTGERV